jgi:RNA polymerase sigma factor (TIGR02999 family)
MPPAHDLTVLLERWRSGDDDAAGELLAAVYNDLRRVAAGYMRGERVGHTLQPTALLHEAWLRLDRATPAKPASREEFFQAMAGYMHRQLLDHARRRGANKRGGRFARADFDDVAPSLAAPPPGSMEVLEPQFQQLDAALAKLSTLNPRAARVVELRMFGGKSVEETAQELSISTGTVKRDYALARVFLLGELSGLGGAGRR